MCEQVSHTFFFLGLVLLVPKTFGEADQSAGAVPRTDNLPWCFVFKLLVRWTCGVAAVINSADSVRTRSNDPIEPRLLPLMESDKWGRRISLVWGLNGPRFLEPANFRSQYKLLMSANYVCSTSQASFFSSIRISSILIATGLRCSGWVGGCSLVCWRGTAQKKDSATAPPFLLIAWSALFQHWMKLFEKTMNITLWKEKHHNSCVVLDMSCRLVWVWRGMHRNYKLKHIKLLVKDTRFLWWASHGWTNRYSSLLSVWSFPASCFPLSEHVLFFKRIWEADLAKWHRFLAHHSDSVSLTWVTVFSLWWREAVQFISSHGRIVPKLSQLKWPWMETTVVTFTVPDGAVFAVSCFKLSLKWKQVGISMLGNGKIDTVFRRKN